MNWLVLGDIGRREFYHLGDEAMTEVALEMLEERGAKTVTLVANDPAMASNLYGRPSVASFGFHWGEGRSGWERRLSTISTSRETGDGMSHVVNAIREADAVLIAGGGNMNSLYPHLLYERVALARIAANFSRPIFVTSQTVGPNLRPRDLELLRELLTMSTCFGARESFSAQLLRGLTDEPSKVVHTFDDAILLRARAEDRESVRSMELAQRRIVATFADDLGTSGLRRDEYIDQIAGLLGGLSERYDADVVLMPHVGSLEGDLETHDRGLNAEIVERSDSGRLLALPMSTARQSIAILEGSLCNVSTRYHPLVFGPQAGVPTVGISLSWYSSVRMRGALSNSGQGHFVIPSTHWSLVSDACEELILLNDREPDTYLDSVGFQARWWDALVEASQGKEWQGFEDLREPIPVAPDGLWSVKVEAARQTYELWSRCAQELQWVNDDLVEYRGRARTAEERRVVRLVDSVANFFRRE